MMQSTIFPDSHNKAIVIIIALAFILAMFGCGGGGGGGDDPSENVTISGKIDDGTLSSPIGNAVCTFYDMNGNLCSQCMADTNGNYSILVSPDNEGYLRCSPPYIPSLALSTFLSTKGLSAGDKSSGENVTPATTIVADIINLEASAVPLARKLELLYDIETGQDLDLQTVVSLSTQLYKSMLQQQVNIQFSGDGGGNDGGDRDSDGPDYGGGVGGEAGDGADFSLISNARCEFIVSDDLTQGTVLYSAALADFLDDGVLNRPDLKEVKEDLDEILQNYQPEEIQAAFEQVFPGSIGDAYFDITDENGEYFLPIPPSVPGFVRCYPQDQEKLVLATYVPERKEDETLAGQDVTPATTVFSHKIASGLSDDLGTVKDNFLDDIEGLEDVHIVKIGGAITGFELQGDPADKDVGLVAFSATSLFNILYKNGVDIDYLAALDDLVDNESVDSDFLEDHGIPPDKAAEWSDIVNSSNEETAETLDTELGSALSKARINVTVTDTPGGDVIAGAMVTSNSGLDCDGCGTETNTEGQVILTFTGVPAETTDIMVEVSAPGYPLKEKTTQIVAFATVDLLVELGGVTPTSFNLTVTKDGSGSGTVTSNPTGISCGSDCTQDYPEDTQVTLTADPDSDSTFAGWSGSCSGTGGCTLTMDQVQTVTATFTPISEVYHRLTVTKAGSGSGTVTATGINCGSDCTQDYEEGTQVTLTADPDSGSTFAGWSGSCSGTGNCTVTMDRARTVTATFTYDTVYHRLTVTKDGSGSGTVTATGISCGSDCTQDYQEDTQVTLTADPDNDSTFAGWSGGCSGTGNCTVTMDRARTVTATFTYDTVYHRLTVTKDGSGSGTVTATGINCGSDCTQDYLEGTQVTLYPAPASDSTFAGWSGSCSGTGNCTVTMDRARTVTATFTYVPGHEITNIILTPESPASMLFGDDVTITFNYNTSEPDGVRIYVRPFTNGSLTPDYGAHASPLYPTGSGNGEGYFTINSGPITVDQLRFQMFNSDQSELLLEFRINCSYTYSMPGPPYIDNISHDYNGYVDWCVTSSGSTFSGYLYDVYFDYSDPDGNAAANDGALVTVNGVVWSWADIGGDGYDGTVTLSYCNSSPGVSLNIYMYDGDEQRSNQLSITLTED